MMPRIQVLLMTLLYLLNGSHGGPYEKELHKALLEDYESQNRPVLNESQPLMLTFGVTLQQIIDVDEKNQLLVSCLWLNLEWNDYQLSWDPVQYGGVKSVRMDPRRVWTPDLLLYNSADEKFDGTYKTNVVVSSAGSCLYVPPGLFKSTCKIDITWFPFDDQQCDIKFGSWTYSGWEVDLIMQSEDGGDVSSFVKNGEWDLIGFPGKKKSVTYKCCPEPYVDITFTIHIRRRTLYYFFNLIVPCVLISSMALLGFTLPPDSGEKLTLDVTVLLSLTVFLNTVSQSMPNTSDAVPLISTYFNCIMMMVASSVVLTVVVLNYHHRTAETHVMPMWVRSVFLQWLPWILRMSRPGRQNAKKIRKINSTLHQLETETHCLVSNGILLPENLRSNPHAREGSFMHVQENPVHCFHNHGINATCNNINQELQNILREIRIMTGRMQMKDELKEVVNDWKFAAMVIDRVCLIIFTSFTVTTTAVILLSAPYVMLD